MSGVGKRSHGAKPGAANLNWKGGRTVDPRGYVLIKMPEHPGADVRGYVYEHRLVMERELGRLLLPGERVRHSDNNPGNNDLENLCLTSRLNRQAMTTCACGCGTSLTALDSSGRARRFVSGHNTPRGIRVRPRPRCEMSIGLDPEWRAEMIADFNGLCGYGCGRPSTEWDHLIPWGFGGSFKMPGNAVPVCHDCNAAKGASTDPWPWIDRGLMADSSAEAMEMVVALALSWGSLDFPDDAETTRVA